jgi:hypothetical protein
MGVDPSIVARRSAGAVVAEPGTTPAPYKPINLS